jgi:hypothetical protein
MTSTPVSYSYDDEVDTSTAVAMALAEEFGTTPEQLPKTLYSAVDPDALDELLEEASGPVSVQFRYEDRSVMVDGTGTVQVDDVEHLH